jgi:hypothetical protein
MGRSRQGDPNTYSGRNISEVRILNYAGPYDAGSYKAVKCRQPRNIMIRTALADLDELMLRCRDDRARAYIAEAVACYRGGAYRAAIVATWVAVCFDVIDKLRELALAGDKEADNVVAAIEKARQTNDITRALRIERELLP